MSWTPMWSTDGLRPAWLGPKPNRWLNVLIITAGFHPTTRPWGPPSYPPPARGHHFSTLLGVLSAPLTSAVNLPEVHKVSVPLLRALKGSDSHHMPTAALAHTPLALAPHFTRLLEHTPNTDPERGKGAPLQTPLPSPLLVYKGFLSASSVTSSEEGRAVGMLPT